MQISVWSVLDSQTVRSCLNLLISILARFAMSSEVQIALPQTNRDFFGGWAVWCAIRASDFAHISNGRRAEFLVIVHLFLISCKFHLLTFHTPTRFEWDPPGCKVALDGSINIHCNSHIAALPRIFIWFQVELNRNDNLAVNDGPPLNYQSRASGSCIETFCEIIIVSTTFVSKAVGPSICNISKANNAGVNCWNDIFIWLQCLVQ